MPIETLIVCVWVCVCACVWACERVCLSCLCCVCVVTLDSTRRPYGIDEQGEEAEALVVVVDRARQHGVQHLHLKVRIAGGLPARRVVSTSQRIIKGKRYKKKFRRKAGDEIELTSTTAQSAYSIAALASNASSCASSLSASNISA